MKTIFPLMLSIVIAFSAYAQGTGVEMLHAQRGISKGIYNTHGNRLILRGVNYNALGDYWQALPDVPASKQFDEHDFELMAQQGFNCVRLIFSWSKLEPERGKYDTVYLAQIKHAVETAAKYNLYVLVDMHQDAWGKYVATTGAETCARPARGWDGAPAWATLTDGVPTCPTQGERESAPAVIRAFNHFWQNTDSIQSCCIAAWQQVVKTVAPYNCVLGYDLLNEPNLGERRYFKEAHLMASYYKKLIKAIRNTEQQNALPQHTVFFETSICWRGKEIPATPLNLFMSEKNIVFAPHHYFGSITNRLNIKQGFGLLKFFANYYRTGMLLGEWGFFGAGDTLKLKEFAKYEDKLLLGSTWWQWAQACGDPHSIHWDGNKWVAPNLSMHLIELNRQAHFTGKTNQTFLRILSRSRVVSFPGTISNVTSDPDNGILAVTGHTHKTGVLTLWVPATQGPPVITGKNIFSTGVIPVPGGYMANVSVKGKYDISVRH